MKELVSPVPFFSISARSPTVSRWRDFKKSNLRQRERKMPGITMSPSPKMEYWGGSVVKSLGNYSLMGASMFLATVIMTSVPKTKKMS
jgi:hypothetical protein